MFQKYKNFCFINQMPSFSQFSWFSVFPMAKSLDSIWKWPGQRPEPSLPVCLNRQTAIMVPDFCPLPDQSCVVCSGVALLRFSRKGSKCQHRAWASGWERCVAVIEGKRNRVSVLPPTEVPQSLCQSPLFSGCYLKDIRVHERPQLQSPSPADCFALTVQRHPLKPQPSTVCLSSEERISGKGRECRPAPAQHCLVASRSGFCLSQGFFDLSFRSLSLKDLGT